MSDKPGGSVHRSFREITAATLIWNDMGVIYFFAQMDPDMLAAHREAERSLVQGRRPAWQPRVFP